MTRAHLEAVRRAGKAPHARHIKAHTTRETPHQLAQEHKMRITASHTEKHVERASERAGRRASHAACMCT